MVRFKPKTKIEERNGLISYKSIDDLLLEIDVHVDKEKEKVGVDLAYYLDVRPILKCLSGR